MLSVKNAPKQDHGSYCREVVIKETSGGRLDYIFVPLGDLARSFSAVATVSVLLAYLVSEATRKLLLAVCTHTGPLLVMRGLAMAAKWFPPVTLLAKACTETTTDPAVN